MAFNKQDIICGLIISALIALFILIFFINKYFVINKIFDEQFSNKDYIDGDDSYDNKYLYEQKVFNMLNPLNKKKYLNLSQTAKDSFLTDISISKI